MRYPLKLTVVQLLLWEWRAGGRSHVSDREKERRRERGESRDEEDQTSGINLHSLGNEVGQQVGKKQDRREKKVQDLRNLLCGIQYTAQYCLHPIAASLPLYLGRCLLHGIPLAANVPNKPHLLHRVFLT